MWYSQMNTIWYSRERALGIDGENKEFRFVQQGCCGYKENYVPWYINASTSFKRDDEDLLKNQMIHKYDDPRDSDDETDEAECARVPPVKPHKPQAHIIKGIVHQCMTWDVLEASIRGYINEVNTSNVRIIARKLLRTNIIRGRGLFALFIVKAQTASPSLTPAYAALTAIINSKFFEIGMLVLKQISVQFNRGFNLNDKSLCISSGIFLAHLFNQHVVWEFIIVDPLTQLLEKSTNDSVEAAIEILKICGMKLTRNEIKSNVIVTIFDMLNNILHKGQLDERVQHMIQVMFEIRRDGFKDYEAVPAELDVVEKKDQKRHWSVSEQNDERNLKIILNNCKFDPNYCASEKQYKKLRKTILANDSSEDDDEEDSKEESSDNESSTPEDGGDEEDRDEESTDNESSTPEDDDNEEDRDEESTDNESSSPEDDDEEDSEEDSEENSEEESSGYESCME
ncbi:pre-mRNA-splicing factor CWC22 homolog [Monomorium pharaonis]|uniref:pre-mRNA-splicing factor CWC22 homolog n=1 Tax=Monomorium pharaonis TaxID=307658 RepID=UPI001745D220|nr:pre-mRNA-splicing factor CWC22 homolog [Monomorium pharaonis]